MRRNAWIDFVRILFSVGIFLTHLNSLAQPTENVDLIYCFGFLGVEFFFIISGYFMAASANKYTQSESEHVGKATMHFLWKKYKRVFPCYFVAWCIGFTADHVVGMITGKQVLKDIIQSIPAFMHLGMAGFPMYQAIDPAWYISAMLLSMFILYPLLLLLRDKFTYIIAPLASIVIYGYLLFRVGNLATINPLEGSFVYTGLLRGIAGISLGCICYEGARFLSRKSFTTKGCRMLTLLELLCYAAVFLGMNTQALMRPDFYVVAILVPAVMLSFSNQSYTSRFRLARIKLGEVSLAIFLADYPARVLTKNLFPTAVLSERILPCVGFLILFAGIILLLSPVVQKLYQRFIEHIRSACFTES